MLITKPTKKKKREEKLIFFDKKKIRIRKSTTRTDLSDTDSSQ